MHRDRVRSQDGLKVRAHDLLNTIDFREFRQFRPVRLRSAFSVCAESVDRNVQSDLVPIFKAVGDGLLNRVNPYRNIIDCNDLNASAKRRLGIPEDSKRYTIYFWNFRVTGKRDIDHMRNLGG